MRDRILKTITLAAITVAWLVLPGIGFAQTQPALEPLNNFPRTQLTIATTDARIHHFNVWIADEGNRRMQGLMFVKEMPADSGMLFNYAVPQPITMWMKNTLIPLDMLFIRADGRIAQVAANAHPMSLKHIESKENVVAVLELNAGTAAKFGITKGAIVTDDHATTDAHH